DRLQGAGVRRVLDGQDVEGGVDVVERRRGGAGEVIGVGVAHDVGRLAEVGVAGAVGQGEVHDGVGRRVAGVDVDAEVLAGVADHAEPVDRGVEVDGELRAAEGERGAGLGGRPGERVDDVNAPGAA